MPKSFFIIPQDVFRLGNSQSPRLSNVRARDVDTMTMNDILVVIANGKGVSVFDEAGIAESPFECNRSREGLMARTADETSGA